MTFEYKKFSPGYGIRFEEMKKRILELSSEKLVIEHVGSTSVKGLGGKGIIDVSIGIKKWSEVGEILKILRKIGFKHFHDIENHGIFVSTRALCEENDFHVHISRVGTKRYERTMAFRNYLRKNPRTAEEYAKMKKEAFCGSGKNRNIYKRLKNEWFSGLEKNVMWLSRSLFES